jgi:hypothetical protein
MAHKRALRNSRRRKVLRTELLENRLLLTGVESEPNNIAAEANTLLIEESTVVPGLNRGVMEGTIESADSDFFEFTALAGDLVSVSVNAVNSMLDPNVVLRNSAGGQLAIDYSGGPDQNSLLATYEISSSGSYLLEVIGNGNTSTGEYALTVITTSSLSLESDQHYFNDNKSRAEPLDLSISGNTFSVSAIGTIMASEGNNSDEDFFAAEFLNADTDVSLSIRKPEWSAVSTVLELVGSDGEPILDTAPDPELFNGTIAADDLYYVRVSAADGAGPDAQYVLDVAITDAVSPVVNEVTRLPSGGESTSSLVASFVTIFSEELAVETVVDSTMDLLGAGDDGSFGTADDVPYNLEFTYRE